MKKTQKTMLIIIIVLSLAGMVDAGYAVTLHYNTGEDSFCSVSETVNCDIVNTSKYSELFGGIPVAGIGFAGYLLYAALSGLMLAGYRLRGLAAWGLMGAALFGVVFSLGLTYIELFILEAICILCVVSQTLVILILAASIVVYASGRRA